MTTSLIPKIINKIFVAYELQIFKQSKFTGLKKGPEKPLEIW